MKRLFALYLAALTLLTLWGCTPETPAESTAAPTVPCTELLTGWQTIDGDTYCFSEDGTPLTGWRVDLPGSPGDRCYLDQTGKVLTGWQEIEGKRYYFTESGAMTTGWVEENGEYFYCGIDGAMFTGLLNIQGNGYYFDREGKRCSGWQEIGENTYYFGQDGIMAVGSVEIEGQLHHFSPKGIWIPLVNPWNMLPEGYEVELVNVTERDRLETRCAQALKDMLAACKEAGYEPSIVSAYRTQEEQGFLFDRKVKYYTDRGWSRTAARTEAAKEIAIPGTSEHETGMALDLVSYSYQLLNEKQENTAEQKWLMEHCWEYGFILRYPVGSTQITGIIYEPWHYRYVGQEIAREIMDLGITLEEYLGTLE